eukprot:5624191-Pyramimonas_sp.AAC.2
MRDHLSAEENSILSKRANFFEGKAFVSFQKLLVDKDFHRLCWYYSPYIHARPIMKLLCAVCEGRPAATMCFAEEALMCEECDGRCVELGLHPRTSRALGILQVNAEPYIKTLITLRSLFLEGSASFWTCSMSQTVEYVPLAPFIHILFPLVCILIILAAPVRNSPTREPFSVNEYDFVGQSSRCVYGWKHIQILPGAEGLYASRAQSVASHRTSLSQGSVRFCFARQA